MVLSSTPLGQFVLWSLRYGALDTVFIDPSYSGHDLVTASWSSRPQLVDISLKTSCFRFIKEVWSGTFINPLSLNSRPFHSILELSIGERTPFAQSLMELWPTPSKTLSLNSRFLDSIVEPLTALLRTSLAPYVAFSFQYGAMELLRIFRSIMEL